jgi:hypothetical protein
MDELNFKIKILSNAVDTCPDLRVLLDDKEYFSGPVFGEETIEFDAEVDKDFDINVEFAGNDPKNFILDDNGTPTNSVSIQLDEIHIDGIDIKEIAYNLSQFNIDPSEQYIEEYTLKECMDFGFKGVWTLPIKVPVYSWILENL